jgi:hypothetical protein
MNSQQAISLLDARVNSDVALELILSIDTSKYEIYGVEGFIVRPEGHEASLDLIFDLSSVMNLSHDEKREFIATFVRNRSSPHTLFEVHGGPVDETETT